jgi:predicted protein tyrosine phosphatase
MIKSNRNALGNCKNPFQGDTKKVLAVCSAGLLRSATVANYLIREHNYNVRNCGVSEEYALIPISEVLICWADEIIFAEQSHLDVVYEEVKMLKGKHTKVKVLNIPDCYNYGSSELLAAIKQKYNSEESNVQLE